MLINKICKHCKCEITLKTAVKVAPNRYRNECKACRKEWIKKRKEMNVQEKDLPKYPVIEPIISRSPEIPTPEDFKEGYKSVKGGISKSWTWLITKLRRKNGI